MSRFHLSLALAFTLAPFGAIDCHANDTSVVYIDPAPHLPEVMTQIVSETLTDISLKELAEHVSQQYGFTCLLRERELGNEGVVAEAKISLFLAGLPLYQALDLACEDVAGVKLAWAINDGILWITTERHAFHFEISQVYDVTHLLERGWDSQRLFDVVQRFTSGNWIRVDGHGGEFNMSRNMLAVRQEQIVQREVATMLDALGRDGDMILVDHPPQHAELFAALNRTVELDVDRQPLHAVLAELSMQAGVTLWPITSPLADIGIQLDAPVTYHAGPRALREVLSRLLVGGFSFKNLTYRIRHGVIIITSEEAACVPGDRILYDVSDLLSGATDDDFVKVVRSATLAAPWGCEEEIGIIPDGYLAVSRSPGAHSILQKLLIEMRAKWVPPMVQAVDPQQSEVRYYFVSQMLADNLQFLLPKVIAPDTWQAVAPYDLDANGWILAVLVSDDFGREDVRSGPRFTRRVQQFNGGFGGGGPGYFQMPIGPVTQSAVAFQGFGGAPRAEVPPSRRTGGSMRHEVALLIRQTVEVHEQIDALIEELIDPEDESRGAFTPGIRSDVLSDREGTLLQRPSHWRVEGVLREREYASADPWVSLPEVMRQPVTTALVDVPLSDTVEFLHEATGLEVVLHESDLADEGVVPTDPVSLPSGVPLHLALNQAYRDVAWAELEWYLDDGILHITTATAASDVMTIGVYDISRFELDESEVRDLIDLIQSQTYDDGNVQWMDIDGFGGNIERIGNLLVVPQTHSVHREVAAILDALTMEARMIVVGEPQEHQALREALNKPVSIDADQMSMAELAATLSAQLGVPVNLRAVDLADEGVAEDDEISGTLHEVPLSLLIGALVDDLSGAKLTYTLDDGAIWITTDSSADDEQYSVIYDVNDIIASMSDSLAEPDYQSLIDMIQAQTGGQWNDIDGFGGEIDSVSQGRLFIRANRFVHDEIEHLLSELRARFPQAPAPDEFDPDRIESRYYELPRVTADCLAALLPQLIEPETWSSIDHPEHVGLIFNIETEEVVDTQDGETGNFVTPVPEMNEETPVANAEAGEIVDVAVSLPVNRLLITQTARNHRRIALFLDELKTGIPASEPCSHEAKQGLNYIEGILSTIVAPR